MDIRFYGYLESPRNLLYLLDISYLDFEKFQFIFHISYICMYTCRVYTYVAIAEML
jgi:hypothetical protein